MSLVIRLIVGVLFLLPISMGVEAALPLRAANGVSTSIALTDDSGAITLTDDSGTTVLIEG